MLKVRELHENPVFIEDIKALLEKLKTEEKTLNNQEHVEISPFKDEITKQTKNNS